MSVTLPSIDVGEPIRHGSLSVSRCFSRHSRFAKQFVGFKQTPSARRDSIRGTIVKTRGHQALQSDLYSHRASLAMLQVVSYSFAFPRVHESPRAGRNSISRWFCRDESQSWIPVCRRLKTQRRSQTDRDVEFPLMPQMRHHKGIQKLPCSMARAQFEIRFEPIAGLCRRKMIRDRRIAYRRGQSRTLRCDDAGNNRFQRSRSGSGVRRETIRKRRRVCSGHRNKKQNTDHRDPTDLSNKT